VIIMTSKTRMLYYGGFMWRTVLTADGTRVVRPHRLDARALAAYPTKGA